MKPRELLERCARGDVRNVRFADLQRLAEALGYNLERVRGSHHIYRHPVIRQTLNLQSHGREAKPYQVRQLLEQVELYALGLEDEP